MNLSYQQLLHELQNSLQQYKIHHSYSHGSDDEKAYRTSRLSETNFIGQGKYTGPKTFKQNDQKRQSRLNRCWNCSKLNCNVKNCPFPKNPKKIRMNRIKHFEAKNGRPQSGVAETLFQFCEEYFENSESSDNETGSDDDDVTNASAEIQHILAKNISTHNEKLNELGFLKRGLFSRQTPCKRLNKFRHAKKRNYKKRKHKIFQERNTTTERWRM